MYIRFYLPLGLPKYLYKKIKKCFCEKCIKCIKCIKYDNEKERLINI